VLQSGKSREDTDYHHHLEAEGQFLTSCRTSAETNTEVIGSDYINILSRYAEAK